MPQAEEDRAFAEWTFSGARGKPGGRPKALTNSKAEMARQLYADKTNSVAEICQTLGIGRTTLYRYVRTNQ